MRLETKSRKKATKGFRQMTGKEASLNLMMQVMVQGKGVFDKALLEMGRMMVESLLLMERETLSGPDYAPTDQHLQKWASEEGSVYIADQKVRVSRPRLRHKVTGEVGLQVYETLKGSGAFSEALLLKLLQGISAQKYEETVLEAANAFGVSPSTVSRKVVALTAQRLSEFQERPLQGTPFAIFLDTIHRGGEAFLVALSVNEAGDKQVLGFWEGTSENHELCEALFRDVERRGLILAKRVLFVTDGGSGLIKALRDRFGQKLLHQRCVIHKGRNIQKHLPKAYRREAQARLTIALEQNSYHEAKKMLLDLEQWLRTLNESAADSLLEAFEALLTLHRLKMPALLRKTLFSTNPIESLFASVRHAERNLKRTRGSKMLQRWLAAALLYCEQNFHKVRGYQHITQVLQEIEQLQTQAIDLRSVA